MIRAAIGLTLAGCAASTAFAQHLADPTLQQIVSAPIVDGGVFDWEHKRWLPAWEAHQLLAANLTVYNNTCTWTGGNFMDAVTSCVTFFDEGRIPGSGGQFPAGASADNLINCFELAYCTKAATGTLDVKVGFYENWGGCLQGLGGTPYTPPLSGNATAYFDFGQAAGFPLPGDPNPGGAFHCTRVTITLGNNAFCMLSDGDGFYDNVARFDNFAWSFENQTAGPASLSAVSLIRAGDPALSPTSGCTYNVPCGQDNSPWLALSPNPNPCGHGLGTEDNWWMNVDNDAWGDTVNTGCSNGAPAQGSGCYFFGGYPTGTFASYWLTLGSAGGCAGCTNAVQSYCTAGTTSSGCTPQMSISGVASATSNQPALLTASNVEGQKTGLIFVAYQAQAVPWAPGSTSFFCVKTPTVRLPPAQNSGGTAGQCNGTIQANINAYVQANNGMLLGQQVTPGLSFNAQGWFRDPPAPKSTNLTNALTVTFCP